MQSGFGINSTACMLDSSVATGGLCIERDNLSVLHRCPNLDGPTAHPAVNNVLVRAMYRIDLLGQCFPTVRTRKGVFEHSRTLLLKALLGSG